MHEKINKTIENICDWINDRLDDSLMTEEVYATANMVTALADLVAASADQDLEKRVADLEVQVQSQQKIDVDNVVDKISLQIEELQKRLNKQDFC